MSVVTSADPSASGYGETRKYKLKGSSADSSGPIPPMYRSIQKFNYGTESYLGNYSSPSEEELPASLADLSCSSTPRNSVNSFANVPYPSDDYEGDDIRLKLKELERALLNDDDNEDGDGYCGGNMEIEIDSDWADPSKNLLLLESSHEEGSSSYESNEVVVQSPAVSSGGGYPFRPSTLAPMPKQLLFSCAAAVSEGHVEEAAAMISELRERVSIQGDPAERIAAYMVEGLAARLAASGKGIYKALKCKEPPSSDRLSAMQVLFEVCPCFRFGFMAANGAISEAVADTDMVHIVDFDINQGSQYITLMQALAGRRPTPPRLRITGVDDPESVQRSVGGLRVIGRRLEELAKALGLPFDFQALAVNIGDISASMLERLCLPGEALIVNFAFQLHHMPDESVSTFNQRDSLLGMVKSLNPKLVTLIEQDVNTNTAPFLQRFGEAYEYYAAVFESLDATLPRESAERMNVERHCLARDIVNIVACEGEERIERYEVAGKWRARMAMAGFEARPLSPAVREGIHKEIVESYCNMYKVKEEGGALQFGWADKYLIVSSAWR